MRILILAAAAGLALSVTASASFASDTPLLKSGKVQIADHAMAPRSKAAIRRDVQGKPADMLAFAGVKPGDKAVDLSPAEGDFARLFAEMIESQGSVHVDAPVVWLSRSFQDFTASLGASPDIVLVNKAVFAALAPGGGLDAAINGPADSLPHRFRKPKS